MINNHDILSAEYLEYSIDDQYITIKTEKGTEKIFISSCEPIDMLILRSLFEIHSISDCPADCSDNMYH